MTDPVWLEPIPERYSTDPASQYEKREKLKIAFILVFQLLNPRQRAVLILRDMLSFSAKETAEILELTTASVNSSLLRARGKLNERVGLYPGDIVDTGNITLEIKNVTNSFLRHWENSDIKGIISMLREDAVLSMPPLSIWFKGHENISGFLADFIFSKKTKLVPIFANEQLAFAGYRFDPESSCYVPHTILLLSIDENHSIHNIIAFLSPNLFPFFKLPEKL